MRGYGQIIDDFPTPTGRYIVVWDLANEHSWYGLVQENFQGEIGTLVAFERSADGASISIVAIERSDLPDHVAPVISPTLGPTNQTGSNKSNLVLVHASA